MNNARRSRNKTATTTSAVVADVAPSTSSSTPSDSADLSLPEFDPSSGLVDLVIAGGGPSGLAVAERVSRAGYTVAIVDPEPLAPWPNTYGVWCDEFEAMGLEDCLEFVWNKANVFLDSTPAGKRELRRPYGRVDRAKLKKRLLERCVDNGVRFLSARAEGVEHGNLFSTLSVSGGNGGVKATIDARIVLDATGHARKLVEWDKPFDPGYQGAYGIAATVDRHPFDVGAMLFMDWRDDHTLGLEEMRASNKRTPTFLYAMPFSETEIFLEETSLVARPAVGFGELKERLERRLEFLEIGVKEVHEVERCLIPMGGALPKLPQRTIGVGGTAGMVHPSTGYMVARALGAAPALGDAIVDALADEFRVKPRRRSGWGAKGTATRASSGATASTSTAEAAPKVSPAPPPEGAADAAAASAWASLWPTARLRQRSFFCFGMDVLLSLDLAETREFFSAFFALSDKNWQGFLSARLGFTELIAFGLSLFAKSSNAARADLLVKGLPGLVVMLFELATLKPVKEEKRET